MDALACMSPSACPPCWHYRAGRCSLLAQVQEALGLQGARAAEAILAVA